MCSSSPAPAPKLQLAAEQASTGGCWIPTKNNTPHPRTKAKPQQDGRRAKLRLESNPMPAADARRTQTQPCAHQDPEARKKPGHTCLWVFGCLLRRNRPAVACRGHRGSDCSRPGSRSVRYRPLGGDPHQPHHRATEQTHTPKEYDFGGQWDLITDLIPQNPGNGLLEGTMKTVCAPGTRRKEQCPHKRPSQTCPSVSRSGGVGDSLTSGQTTRREHRKLD